MCVWWGAAPVDVCECVHTHWDLQARHFKQREQLVFRPGDRRQMA